MDTALDASTLITSVNPANQQTLGQVNVTTPDQIAEIVEAAKQAQKQWAKTGLNKRLLLIEEFRKLLYDSKEELAKLITSETGKPRVESMVAEIFSVLETCAWLRQHAQATLNPQKVHLNSIFLPGKRAYNVYEPLGVIAIISPWNYPFSIPVTSICSALVAGNSVIWKPSPKAALIAQFAVDLFRRSGLPHNLIGLVQGDRVEAESVILSDVQRVMFTGSTPGGKAIMALAAKKLLPVTLELGGKHAAIVLDDSDVDAIVRPLVWAAFTNAGQACASIERLYVTSGIKEKLLDKLAARVQQLKIGDGMDPGVDVGPLIDESQVHRVQDQVADALAQGARLLAGGKARLDMGGNFFEPTLLAGARAGMRVIDEEIFGPVLPIVEVSNEQEAITLANNSKLGLGASIWTRDLERAEQLARQIEAGAVWINDGLYTHVSPDAPWGGIKESGFGRMHSAIELKDLVYCKTIGVNAQQPQTWNFPYSEASLDYVRGGLDLTHGLVANRLAALRKVIDAFLRLSGKK